MKSSPLSFISLLMLLPVTLYAADLEIETWPSFGKEMSHFCEANPYDCKSNEIVSAYKMNTFNLSETNLVAPYRLIGAQE